MEAEAGEKSVDFSDADGNRYGAQFNKLDDELEKLYTRRSELETKLAY